MQGYRIQLVSLRNNTVFTIPLVTLYTVTTLCAVMRETAKLVASTKLSQHTSKIQSKFSTTLEMHSNLLMDCNVYSDEACYCNPRKMLNKTPRAYKRMQERPGHSLSRQKSGACETDKV